jgi:hypothetical protein
MIGESRRRCIAACIGRNRVGSEVPVGDIVAEFGRDAVLEVARSMVNRYASGAADHVVYEITGERP